MTARGIKIEDKAEIRIMAWPLTGRRDRDGIERRRKGGCSGVAPITSGRAADAGECRILGDQGSPARTVVTGTVAPRKLSGGIWQPKITVGIVDPRVRIRRNPLREF